MFRSKISHPAIALLFFLLCFLEAATVIAQRIERIPITSYERVWTDKGSGNEKNLSIWHPKNVPAGYFVFGSVGMASDNNPNGRITTYAYRTTKPFKEAYRKDLIVRPTSFKKEWSDSGSGADQDLNLWFPVCPEGYAPLGLVASNSGSSVPSSIQNSCGCIRRWKIFISDDNKIQPHHEWSYFTGGSSNAKYVQLFDGEVGDNRIVAFTEKVKYDRNIGSSLELYLMREGINFDANGIKNYELTGNAESTFLLDLDAKKLYDITASSSWKVLASDVVEAFAFGDHLVVTFVNGDEKRYSISQKRFDAGTLNRFDAEEVEGAEGAEDTEEVNNSFDRNYSLAFNGSNNYVNLGNPYFYGNSFTIQAWVRPEDKATGTVLNVSQGKLSAMFLMFNNDGKLRFTVRNPVGNSGGVEVVSKTTFTDDKWRHIAAVKGDDDRLYLYVDGKREAVSTKVAKDFGERKSFVTYMGANIPGVADRLYDGLMDDFSIWSKAFTGEAIASNYLKIPKKGENGLVSYYTFDESGANTKLTDYNGKYDGTLVGYGKSPGSKAFSSEDRHSNLDGRVFRIKSRQPNDGFQFLGTGKPDLGEEIGLYNLDFPYVLTFRILKTMDGRHLLSATNARAFVLEIDSQSAAIEDGARIQLGKQNAAPGQYWLLDPQSDGVYFIRTADPKGNNRVLDVTGYGTKKAGSKVHLWTEHGYYNQQWELVPVD